MFHTLYLQRRLATAATLAFLTATSVAEQRPNTESAKASAKYQQIAMAPALSLGLEVLVITGTRTAQVLIDNPVRVEVIDKETLERHHALDLAEAVQTIPGLSLRPVRGKEGSEAWMQGISANRVLVLVDGEQVSSSTGSAVDLTQVSTAGIERVEIVKGASSVLYGSQAMGGVINVITAEPEEGLHYDFSADAGSYGDQNTGGKDNSIGKNRYSANLSYKNEHWIATAGINARFSEGYSPHPDYWDQQGADGHKINARASLRYSPSDSSFYQLSHERYDQEQHTQYTLYPPPNNVDRQHKQDDAQREHTAIRAFWEFDNNDINLQAFTEDYHNLSAPKSTFSRDAKFKTNKASIQWNSYIHENNTLTVGADLFEENLNQFKMENGIITIEVDDANRDSVELFVQDEISLGQLTLLPGLRGQKDSDFGKHFTPKLGSRWDFDNNFTESNNLDMFIRASIGEGYRVSNLKERHFIFDHSHLGYILKGNADLQPESSLSYQLGFVIADRDRFQSEINFFRNELTSLIETVYSHDNSEGIQIHTYENVDEALTQGVEISGKFKASNKLRLQAGYVYLEAINDKTGERLRDRPENQIKAQIDYMLPLEIDLGLIASWQDEEVDVSRNLESPGWSKFDLKLNKQMTNSLKLYAGINNISNTQRDFYDDDHYDNRPLEPRLIYIGFKIHN
ncbi:MAG: TonB-dependent receptor [Pseudomonadales bacterium]|nr:TonB-dependent receptor [Pseudomonadales bacterium]